MLKTGPLESIVGSGKFGPPWERMHAENATADAEVVDPPAFGEPEPVAAPLPLHAAATRARPAPAVTANATCAAGGHARRERRTSRVLSLTVRQRRNLSCA